MEDDPFLAKFASLNHAVCELIDDFRLVSFQPLHIEVQAMQHHSSIVRCVDVFGAQDKESTYNLLKVIDKSNGYVFGGLTEGNESIMEVADADGFEYFRCVIAIHLNSRPHHRAGLKCVSHRWCSVAAVQDKYMNAEDWEDSE